MDTGEAAARLVALRGSLFAARQPRRAWWGAALVVGGFALWLALFLGTLVVDAVLLKVLLASANGVLIGLLFIAGHDASHGALSDRPALDRWLARLAFLPSLHTHGSWDRDHNRAHHNWTNLAGHDPGYVPLTLAQFNALPRRRRAWIKATHNVAGMGFGYLPIWWRMTRQTTPGVGAGRGVTRASLRAELLGLCLFAAATAACVGAFGSARGAGSAWVLAEWLLAFVVPFTVFIWMMAFVTWPQHTHPQVRWYDRRDEWSAWHGQLGGTVHVVWPRGLAWAFLHIFTHTAHHLDRRQPLYRLAGQQALIEAEAPGSVVRVPANWALWRELFRTCRLYDYRAHAWLDWDGRVLARPPAPR
jgi:acyl-lipid omega-6 desaturase (Delta-12 desaturase)